MPITDILADHPHKATFDLAELSAAIRACLECAVACAACADSDLSRNATEMSDCIARCLDCSDIAITTAKILARPRPTGDAWLELLGACAEACTECGDECSTHDHVCCQQCAEACRACEQACRQLMAVAS